jgi:hypothetical protein
MNSKPTLDTPIITIPIHIHGSHWVTLTCRRLNSSVIFFYSDDMNSAHTEDHIKNHFSAACTSNAFHPVNSLWIDCNSFSYFPHSNECGPRSLLALSVMALHPSLSTNSLLPLMHFNIAQICWWWVAAILISDSSLLSSLPISRDICHTPYHSLNQESCPSNIAHLPLSITVMDVSFLYHHKLDEHINELHAILNSNPASFTNDHASQLDTIDRHLTDIMLAGERQSSRKPQQQQHWSPEQ